MKWFTSDWHLGHEAVIAKGGRAFKDVKEMNETIIYRVLSTCKRGDILYFLGDIGWDENPIEEMLYQLSKNKIQFVWVLGNHDERLEKRFRTLIKQYSRKNAVYSFYETKLTDKEFKRYPTTLCHFPMLTWNKSHYNSFQLYGHHHLTTWKHEEMKAFELTGKKLNVCCEFHDYKPISELEVIEIMKTRPDNWDYLDKTNKGIK